LRRALEYLVVFGGGTRPGKFPQRKGTRERKRKKKGDHVHKGRTASDATRWYKYTKKEEGGFWEKKKTPVERGKSSLPGAFYGEQHFRPWEGWDKGGERAKRDGGSVVGKNLA